MRRALLLLAVAACLLAAVPHRPMSAEPPGTRPVAGLREHTPRDYALVGARIVQSPGRVIERGVIVVRRGMIVRVGADIQPPADVRQLDMSGKTIYPGFLDPFTEQEVATSVKVSAAPHWNARIRPQLSMARQYQADNGLNKKLRSQGITARLVAPNGGILKGTSLVATTAEGSPEQTIVRDSVAQHLRLTVARGGSREDYPNSPMGAVALARQTFYDARWYHEAHAAAAANSELPRPERNDALAALSDWNRAGRPIIVDAINELYALRADRFAREFNVPIVLRGSGNEYRRLDAIRGLGRTVIVPVDFPKPPNVGTVESSADVTLETLMHWDHAPENPARLQAAGVKIALTTFGLSDPKSFLKAVRKAVSRGLSADDALRALTATPAELCGVSSELGSIDAGKRAHLIVSDGDLLSGEAKVVETWVDGIRYEHKTEPAQDPRGQWTVQGGGIPALRLTIEGTAGKLSGTVVPAAEKDPEDIKLTRITQRDSRISTVFPGARFGHDGFVRLTLVVSPTADGKLQATGRITWPNGHSVEVTGTWQAAPPKEDEEKPAEEKPAGGKAEKGPKPDDPGENAASPSDAAAPPADAASNSASYPLVYPLGRFGREKPPERPAVVAFRNATVWTCGPQGVLQGATLLIRNGRVAAVGKDVAVPAGAVVVELAGQHITPGIIDCHSHMATDGGVNESTQTITAEVRIGDFIDADDVNIYRQLAGGVTSSNILHGSANPIGGQNQVIKLRWGTIPDAMKFAEAPQGIKFALGENVKQSNWGDEYTTRYPQTRMGVVEIMRDAFEAARRYDQQHKAWQTNRRGLPPRRDLEQDALAEVVAGTRWIHCHSYRQDEILALIRTLDDFKITIGTFQHILEGYKVADAMAKHGAMGSAFSDWWAYKFEVYDAIPYNGTLMHNAGVVVSFNSDDRELARHLNHEAAKAVKYGGVPEAEALKFVTLNPARQLRIDKWVGSLEVGKHADVAVWSGHPLSTMSRCEQTWVDGRKYFDRSDDLARRAAATAQRAALIQKILKSGEAMLAPGEKNRSEEELWPRDDIFCHHHDHDHDHGKHRRK